MDLRQAAILYGAQADAFNIYCEKDSALAQSLMTKFSKEESVSEDDMALFQEIKEASFSAAYQALKKVVPDCKNVDFMMGRLKLMQKLRDVSYRLNGVDPETVPQPEIPDIEELLPAPRDVPLQPMKL